MFCPECGVRCRSIVAADSLCFRCDECGEHWFYDADRAEYADVEPQDCPNNESADLLHGASPVSDHEAALFLRMEILEPFADHSHLYREFQEGSEYDDWEWDVRFESGLRLLRAIEAKGQEKGAS